MLHACSEEVGAGLEHVGDGEEVGLGVGVTPTQHTFGVPATGFDPKKVSSQGTDVVGGLVTAREVQPVEGRVDPFAPYHTVRLPVLGSVQSLFSFEQYVVFGGHKLDDGEGVGVPVGAGVQPGIVGLG